MSDQAQAIRVLAALARTPIGDSAVLVGSSGLFGFATAVPALTEDIDVAIPERIALEAGTAIVSALRALGFAHEPGTATFVAADGTVFDLLGHGDPRSDDHVAGSEPLRVMVFSDLSRIISRAGAVERLAGGSRGLTPAGFAAAKLLTERGHKGAKDKIQALLVIAERASSPDFRATLRDLLGEVPEERRQDLEASAQEALLLLSRDPTFEDAGASGYSDAARKAQAGFATLLDLLGGNRA